MNGNKLFFYLFSLVLLINGFFGLEINGNYFLSSIIGNPIWREIVLGGVAYYFGYKYVKEVEQSKENTKLKNFTNTLSNLFLLCLGLLAFQSIFGQSIFGFDLSSYKLGAIILNLIQNLQYALVILAIIFGSLIFYVNREEVENLEKDKKEEEISDKKAYFYLFLIIIFSTIVKLYFIDYWGYFRDEYNILQEAKFLHFTGNYVHTQLSHFIIFFDKLYDIFGFNNSYLFNRLPFVLISILNVILLYLIGKKLYSKKIGLLLSLLFSLNFLSFELSLYIREYEFNMLILNIFILLIINTKKLFNQILIFITYLITFIYFKNNGSTFIATILIIFPLFFIKIYSYSNIRKIIQKYKYYLLLTTLLISLFFIYYFNLSWLFKFKTNYTWAKYIININYVFGVVFFTLFIIHSIFYNETKKNRYIIFIILFSLAFYTYIFGRYFAPRYIYYLLPIVLLTLSISVIIVSSYTQKTIYLIFIIILPYILYFNNKIINKNEKNFNNSIGTYSYEYGKNKVNFKEVLDNLQIDIYNDAIITNIGSVIGFNVYNINKNTCVYEYNKIYHYETFCNFYQIKNINNIDIEKLLENGKNVYIITEWKTFYKQKGEIKKLPYKKQILLNKDYKIIKLEKDIK